MDEHQFQAHVHEEINKLQTTLGIPVPYPANGTTGSLFECLNGLVEAVKVLEKGENELQGKSVEQLKIEEALLINEKKALLDQLKQSHDYEEYLNSTEGKLPKNFRNRPLASVVEDLTKLQQKVRVAEVELDISEFSEQQDLQFDKDLEEFKELAKKAAAEMK